MRFKKLTVFILACVLSMVTFSGCFLRDLLIKHECESVCPECKKCLDETCRESACKEKCDCEEEKPAQKAVTMVVSKGGSEQALHFDTLDEAVSEAESKIVASSERIDVTISLASGKYALKETLIVDGNDMIDKDYTLTLKGAGAEKTTVTSEVEINSDDLDDYGNGQYAYQLPETLKMDGKYPAVHDFYLNGELISMAKTENFVLAYDPEKLDEEGEPVVGDEKVIYLDSRIFTGMEATDIAGAELWLENVWDIYCVHIESYDMSKTRSDKDGNVLCAAVIRSSDWDCLMDINASLVGQQYWVTNSDYFFNEDNINTFVYDREEGIFYIQLDASVDVEEVKISFPVLNTLISLQNVKNVTVSDIRFTGTTNTYVAERNYVGGQAGTIYGTPGESIVGVLPYAAIFGNDVNGVNVKNCAFDNLGTDGVNFRGAVDNVVITDNSFARIASTAVRFADNSGHMHDKYYDEENHYCNITIKNNFINQTGIVYLNAPAVHVYHVKNLDLTHNTILHSSYSAISVGWGWRAISDEAINVYNAEIAYNYIEGFMENLADGGAIYVLGGNASFEWKDPFNFMHDNFCVVTQETETANYTVLYLDGSSTNWAVNNNVIRALSDVAPKMNYINFQTVGGQQVFNCTANGNYVVGITDESYIFGQGLAAGESYGLSESNNIAVKDYATLQAQYANALEIIQASGCMDHLGEWTED